MIHVDEGWCCDKTDQLSSDADTEIMATPEFWALISGNFAVPVYKGEAVDSSSVRAPTRSPVCEDPKDLRSFEQSTPNCFHLDGKSPKVTKNSFDALENCSGLKATRIEEVANSDVSTLSQRLFVLWLSY